MLCPEVDKFPAPKVVTFCKQTEKFEDVESKIKLNNFYKSVIITCPDEMKTPDSVEDAATGDVEYYKLLDCSITEFIDPCFIEYFVKKGKLNFLTADRNCIIQNCASITPDGTLTMHILEYVYQTLGLEGVKRPHNFYEIKIDLRTMKHHDKIKQSLKKLELFDFYISWEPDNKDVCPSSIAKYFHDKNIEVILQTALVKRLNPAVNEIPSIKDIEPDDMTEWIGMLAMGGDLNPTETYISTYTQPDSDIALKTTRISQLIVKGFFTSTVILNICKKLSEYVNSRELDNYWASISVQSYEDSPWQWSPSSVRMFQAHNSSCNIYLTHNSCVIHSVGEIKYS